MNHSVELILGKKAGSMTFKVSAIGNLHNLVMPDFKAISFNLKKM